MLDKVTTPHRLVPAILGGRKPLGTHTERNPNQAPSGQNAPEVVSRIYREFVECPSSFQLVEPFVHFFHFDYSPVSTGKKRREKVVQRQGNSKPDPNCRVARC